MVHHAAYFRFLEQARVELMRDRGVEYGSFEAEHGKGLPVVDVHVRYRRPCFFDDELQVETRVGRISRATIRFDYQVFRGEVLALSAEISCACVDLSRMRVCSLHPVFREAFG